MNIEHRRQLLVIDFDQRQRLFRSIRCQSGHGGDRIADVADFIDRHDCLIFEYRTIIRFDTLVVEDIVAREHRHDAGNLQCLGSIDTLDTRVRVRAAQDLSVTHTRYFQVRQILRLPGHFRFVVQTAHRFADLC